MGDPILIEDFVGPETLGYLQPFIPLVVVESAMADKTRFSCRLIGHQSSFRSIL